jgi:hypothetical protein
MWPQWASSAGICKHGNETSVSIKEGKFLDQPSDFWRLKKDFTSHPKHSTIKP